MNTELKTSKSSPTVKQPTSVHSEMLTAIRAGFAKKESQRIRSKANRVNERLGSGQIREEASSYLYPVEIKDELRSDYIPLKYHRANGQVLTFTFLPLAQAERAKIDQVYHQIWAHNYTLTLLGVSPSQ